MSRTGSGSGVDFSTTFGFILPFELCLATALLGISTISSFARTGSIAWISGSIGLLVVGSMRLDSSASISQISSFFAIKGSSISFTG